MRVRLRDDAHPLNEVLRAGDLVLDVGRLQANIGDGPVALTRLEFLLLRELMEHAGQSVGKGQLLASVWGYDFDPGSNVVDVCVRRLRSKLGFELIKTVRGEGYRLALPERARPSHRLRRLPDARLASLRPAGPGRPGLPGQHCGPASDWPRPGLAGPRLGRLLARQPGRDRGLQPMGDRPVPLHLDQPHAALRVPVWSISRPCGCSRRSCVTTFAAIGWDVFRGSAEPWMS